jgi:hypothetical protein
VRETGSTEPGKIGGHRKLLLAGHEALLRELTATRKGITLAEIRDALIERGIQPGSLTTIWWTLRRLGLTHKKTLHAAEQKRPDVAEHRRFWRVWQRYMDAASLVFIDETGASTSMVRHYGWHPRGERLVDAAPHGHWHTTTFVASRHWSYCPVRPRRTADRQGVPCLCRAVPRTRARSG